METNEILKIKSDLINEIRGQVAARGYFDIEGKTRFLNTYRGKGKPYEKCTMTCEQEYALIDMTDTYFRAPVTQLYFYAGKCELMVECGSAFDSARNLSIDDLMNIRDLVCSMTDNDIRECREFAENGGCLDDQEND